MLCQKCKKNQATVYYKQNINGSVTQIALCQDCAKELGTFDDGGFFTAGALNLLGNLLGGRAVRDMRAQTPVMQKVCPLCGSTLRDIQTTGKVQCAKCYEVFADELAPIIANIHGSVVHNGRSPKRHGEPEKNEQPDVKAAESVDNTEKAAEIPADPKIAELKAKLSDAVKNEEYENAAKLRDEIRALEKESE